MGIREVIRSIVREEMGSGLRQIVREVLMEELDEAPTPDLPEEKNSAEKSAAEKSAAAERSERAKRGAKTRLMNQQNGKLPKKARAMGLALHQVWRGKKYLDEVKDRKIEIVTIDQTGLVPKVLENGRSTSHTKHMSFDNLRRRYDRIS